ncbi:MAG TPA: DNA cytosine methyltransferase [Verrucomicrobiae bacterium]
MQTLDLPAPSARALCTRHTPKRKTLRFVDLFCGGGGTSNGAKEAMRAAQYDPESTHINHWKVAIRTIRKNHPKDRHYCTGVDDINPRSLYKLGELDVLWASPECTHHSRARGGKPMNEQSRATAHCVTRWAEALQPRIILVENVPEFLEWGPLMKVRRMEKVKWPSLSLTEWSEKTNEQTINSYRAKWKKANRKKTKRAPSLRQLWMKHCPKTKQEKMCNVWIPDPRYKGKTFLAWKGMLESLGYKVAWKLICCADYNDPTTRQRLFVQAVRGNLKIVWPNRTNAPMEEILARQSADSPDLFASTAPKLRPWRSAAECIDWSLEGRYLDEMPGKKQYNGLPLSPKTIARIYNGLLKFGIRPYILPKESGLNRVHSVDQPLKTLTCESRGEAIVRPIIVTIDQQSNGNGTAPDTDPLTTGTTKQRHCVAEPTLVELRGTSPDQVKASAKSINGPLTAVNTSGAHHGLYDGVIVPTAFGEREGQSPRCQTTRQPMHSIVGSPTHGFAKPELEPLLIETAHGNSGGIRAHRPDEPMKAVCGERGSMSIAQPEMTTFVLGQQSGSVLRPSTEPVPAVACAGAISIIETELGEQIHITVPEGTELKPFVVKFYNTATGQPVADPLDTITCKERFALVVPCVEIAGRIFRIRLRWRMLQPHELQLAQGFPRNYKFSGTKTEVVKQIGNAVPRNTARALVYAVLTQNPDVSALCEMSFAE